MSSLGELSFAGPQLWTIYNDRHCFGEEARAVLSLTHCNDNQFTCDSGLCVDISDRSGEREEREERKEREERRSCNNLNITGATVPRAAMISRTNLIVR